MHSQVHLDLSVASIGVWRPPVRAPMAKSMMPLLLKSPYNTGAIVSAALSPARITSGTADRPPEPYTSTTVVNVGKQGPRGGDNQVVKPVVIQISQQHRAFLLVFFLVVRLGGGVNTASVLTGEGTNQVEGEGWTGLGSSGHLLNVICIEVHAQASTRSPSVSKIRVSCSNSSIRSKTTSPVMVLE